MDPQEPLATEPTQPDTPPPVRRRRTGLIVGLAAAAVLLLAGAGVALFLVTRPGAVPGISTPATIDVNGDLTILDIDCGGLGYDDLHDGTEVTLTDEHSTVVAVGALRKTGNCSYIFKLDKVPPGHPFYGVTVSHRGTVHYTETQLRAGVKLSIG